MNHNDDILLKLSGPLQSRFCFSGEAFRAWKTAVASITVLVVVSLVGLVIIITCVRQKRGIIFDDY